MPDAFSQTDTHVFMDRGGALQVEVPAGEHGLGSTINATSQITSNLLKSGGYRIGAVGITSSQAGQISIQRYLDEDGLVQQGAALTAALTAGTPGVLNIVDGNPFKTFKVTITNSGSAVANLTNLGILLQAD